MVQILDLLHVTPRRWQAAQLLCGPRSPEVVPCVRQWLMQVLEGKVDSVLRGLSRRGRDQGLRYVSIVAGVRSPEIRRDR